MKTKIFTLFILVAMACLPLEARAYERNFPAGSIIIPMDAFYQPEDDGGLLETYGLAYYLLNHQDPNSACMIAAAADPATDEDVITCLTDCANGDIACEQACVEKAQEKCRDVTVSWVINDLKTAVDGVDLVIEDTTLPRPDDGVSAVVKLYDHAGGTTNLTFNGAETPIPDSVTRITYHGSLFIVDVGELADGVEAQVYDLINGSSWDAVNVHVAQVPFAAPVHRDMLGTPPKIALMNDGEDKEKGNASILESYLRLAGICNDSYEVVTPNEIAGLSSDIKNPATIDPVLGPNGPGYDFLWAPHWVGEKKYDGTGGYAHQDAVVANIREYIKEGHGMLAECASIETFEHNPNGRFLSDKGFGHNGVDKKAYDVLYTGVDLAYTQIGDFTAGFEPEGGHLHNWRPYQAGDPYNFDDLPDVDGGNSVYNKTVQRFTSDDSDHNDVLDVSGWDYFVGGYAYGNDDFGYVVYLGGHSYADCKDVKEEKDNKDEELNPEPNVHPVDIELKKAISTEVFTLKVGYLWKSGPYLETVSFEMEVDDTLKVLGTTGLHSPLEIDLTEASVQKDKKLVNIILRNKDNESAVTVTALGLSWTGGVELDEQAIKKLTDQFADVEHIKEGSPYIFLKPAPPPADASFSMAPVDFVIEVGADIIKDGEEDVGCTNNAGCEFKNLAGVRYVLNTLFNIKYEMGSPEYVRSAPIVAGDWLYQGTFKHPSLINEGHFRRYKVWCDPPAADWDTGSADAIEINIPDAGDGNPTDAGGDLNDAKGILGDRRVYTAHYDAGNKTWNIIDFEDDDTDSNFTFLKAGLNVAPGEESKIIKRLRGIDWVYENGTGTYVQRTSKRLGGIMHSAPAVVRNSDHNTRFYPLDPNWERPEMAYVGDLYGMLHAIKTGGPGTDGDPENDNDKKTCGPESGGGKELWAYIPSNLLGKLKNDRTDPNAESDFAAVDGSPTAKDIYWDHDANPSTPDRWRTILVGTQGFGGNSIFALDVTDPENFEVLWEATDDQAPGGGMGYAFRAALDKIKVPVLDVYGDPIDGKYEVKWMVYVATSFVDIAEKPGGINVFAFDLATGTKQWTFSSTYVNSVNDIPGAVTTFDIDDDTLADRLYVGDMNGRMWEIALTDDPAPDERWEAGESVHIYDGPDPADQGNTLTMPIPLFYAGIDYPISVSPAIIIRNNHVLLVFGTGGADWASNDNYYYIYAVDATEAGRLKLTEKNQNYLDYEMAIVPYSETENKLIPWQLKLDKGEKVWSSPTISAGQIWVVTSFGSMESADPKNDASTLDYSKLRKINLDGELKFTSDKFGKVRGSIYISRKHIYMTTFNNDIIQLGEEDFTAGTGNRVVLKSWQDR